MTIRARACLRLAGFLLLLCTPLGGCEAATGGGAGGTPPGGPPGAAPASGADRGPAAAAQASLDTPFVALSDSAFVRLVERLSEPGAYFDTDNLISNESSYLHALGALARLGVRGGVYIGVGPDQNFSYIAAIRPHLAFLLDIRRDNLLQHLWFRALFEASPTRLDYLCLMLARRCGGRSTGLDVEALVGQVDAAARIERPDTLIERVARNAAAVGVPVSAADLETIRSIHHRFARDGLDLRFNTHGRAPRPYYPTLRGLLLERDRDGRQASYLAGEADFGFVRALHRANRVIPVVGDLAGPHALRSIGAEVERRGAVVSGVYVSNVEFYLFDDGAFDRFIGNLAALPVGPSSAIIRSYFNRFRSLDATLPGYASTQLVQTIPALLADWEEGRIRRYRDVVERSEGR